MALVTVADLTVGFGGPPLLDGVSFQVEPGQRVGLLGRNGAGKTTLLRVLKGDIEPDSGDVRFAQGSTCRYLEQDVPQGIEGRVREVIEADVSGEAAFVSVESGSEWKTEQRLDQVLTRMSLDGNADFETLSSGMKRRVLLARALVAAPDLLLLDEPTNHLDIESITWLEEFLGRSPTTLVFVTHDRTFLGAVARRIVEIDRGRLFDWSCDYATFLQRKEAMLAAEARENVEFDKVLAREEVWVRRGVKERRKRNQGRVRRLEAMRGARRDRRERAGNVQVQIQEGRRSGNLVAEVEGLTFSFGESSIVKNFSTTILRGDKIGIIGPNGVGKTTLMRLLLGELEPEKGSVRLGTNLQIAYFDQLRGQLRDNATIQDNITDGYDSVQIEGKSQHIMGYLQSFLFTPDRARTLVGMLSGGERNRVLLARLFSKPANVIVLDEPTNDLDTETLELLEERLVEYKGTVVLISHDRSFLNNVVTSTIAFEGGAVNEYVGGYDDWLRQRPQDAARDARVAKKSARQTSSGTQGRSQQGGSDRQRRLSYKETRELEALPAQIEALESELAEIHAAMGQPDFYRQVGEIIAEKQVRVKEIESDLATSYARWEELEKLAP
jgi:ATP-binding cassette subfamily F protein uup